jgi:hypothetical protein
LTEIFANGGERAAVSVTATSYTMKRSVHVKRTEMLRTAKTDDNSALPEWNQDRFVISALNAPPAGLTGRFSGSMDLALRYRQLREANFTMVLGQLATEVTADQPFGNTEAILTAAEHAGLKVLLLPLGSIDTNASTEQLASSLTNSSSAALWGWHLADEPPDVAHFKTLASWKRLIDRHRPGKLSYVNLLPPSCVHYGQGPWGYSGYDGSQDGYLNQFISAMQKPQVMSFDLYPYFEAADSGAMPTKDCGGSCDNCGTAQGDNTPSCCCCNCTRSGYRRGLESHRLASRRLGGTPFWVYLNILPYNGHRDPTIGQIAWQVFTALTYGATGILYFVNWPDPDPKLFGYGDALIVRKASPTAGGVSGASIRVSDYIPGHHMEEVKRINSIVLAYGKYLLRAASTAIFHLPAAAADGGSHAAALNASRILDDLSGGCDCASSPGGQGCNLLLQGFEHCGHYLVGEFRLADGRPGLVIHNQDPDGAQWPTVALHYGISYGQVLEVDPVHGTLAPVLDSSPLLPGLQLRLAPGMARMFVVTT